MDAVQHEDERHENRVNVRRSEQPTKRGPRLESRDALAHNEIRTLGSAAPPEDSGTSSIIFAPQNRST